MARESDDRIDRLEIQIKEIRDMLEGATRPKVSDISPEDLQAYVRVRDVIATDVDNCGINECFRCIGICRACRVCTVCAVCRVCIVECSCGPCNVGGAGGLAGNLERFRDLGG